MILSLRTFALTALVALAVASTSWAQVKLPKPPDSYDVEFRYRIKAGQNDRITQFLEMTKYLKKLGFKETETDDTDLAQFDPNAERMFGKIPSATARDVLTEARIHTVLLVPGGFKPPADEKDRVKVLIELNSGFTPERQRIFTQQVKQVLGAVGYQDAVAYDHKGFTLLRGSMPWGKVQPLLKDLRGQPSGWFLPITHEDELPEPLKTKLPIRLIEVQPEDGAPAPVMSQASLPAIAPEQPQLVKLSADLRRYLLEDGKVVVPVRVEVTLDHTPTEGDNSWRERLRFANPATTIEGRIGNVVTLSVGAGEQITQIARIPMVLSIRLPRAADTPMPVAPKEDPKKDEKDKAAFGDLVLVRAAAEFDVLKDTRLDRLHAHGKRGAGVRVAIIDTDFTGWEKFVGKGLPRTTHYVDLTAERNSEIQPEPSVAAPGRMGHGTHSALAVRFAAPDADISLIRIAPDAPYQIIAAYRYMFGEYFQPESFRMRREELELDAGSVKGERDAANAQYRKAFDDFDDDDAAIARRRAAKAAIAAVEEKERHLTARANRLLDLERDLVKLKGCTVILNNVGWNSGLPLDATSTLSRYLDERMSVAKPSVILNGAKQVKPTVWFQPAGDTRGQSWLGEFQDADGNGIMDWAPPSTPRKSGRWTPELNFLSFRSDTQPDEADLPAGARIRITIQWREPHDPGIAETEYRQPIAPLNLMLLRQRDPKGDKLPTDEMEIVARSEGDPERLLAERDFGIYEQIIDVTLPSAGRYALRVDGKQPIGIRPGGALGIPEQEIRWELKPRIFLEVVDAPTRAKGRVVFGDYESFLGGVAVPADARTVVAVGSMDAGKKPQPYSAIGAGLVSDLFIKPDIITFDQLPKLGDGTGAAKGTSLSAALATGIGTSLLSAGAPAANFLQSLRFQPGHIFEVPEGWLRK